MLQKATAENVHTFLRYNQRTAEVVVPFFGGGCEVHNNMGNCPLSSLSLNMTPKSCPIIEQGWGQLGPRSH